MDPPAKRREGESFGVQQYSSPQPDMSERPGGGSGGGLGPERLLVQSQFQYPYMRDRQGPPQHVVMGSGPPSMSGAPGGGPQANIWPQGTEMGCTYSWQGQAPPYPGRVDDLEGRAPQQNHWPSCHPGQHQLAYSPHPFPTVPPLPIRQPPSSFLVSSTVPNHVSRSHSPCSFPSPRGGSLSPTCVSYLPHINKPGPALTEAPPLNYRESNFQPCSTEATEPDLKPRRRLTANDTGQTKRPDTHLIHT